MKIELINRKFGIYAKWLIRFRWLALVLFALAVFGGVCGLKHLVVETSFDDYFVEGDPMLIKTDEFKSHFGNDYFIGVLTECDNHFTTESLTTLRQLSNELLDSLSYIDKITSLTDIEFLVGNDEGMAIEQVVPESIPTDKAGLDSIRSKAYCKPEIARKLVSKDGRLSWIVIKLRPFPEDSVWKKSGTIAPELITGAEVEKIISKPCYSSLNPKATGMPFVNQQKMKFIGQDMKRMVMIALAISFIVMLLATMSWQGVTAPFISTFGGLILTFGVAGWLGLYVDSATTMIPVMLAFAVAIAYNIHIFSYFRQRMRLHGQRIQAVVETIEETGWATFFCGATTIVSLLSFLAVAIRPVKAIGINTSLCVLFVLLTTLVITPILLSIGRNKKPKPENKRISFLAQLSMGIGDFALRHSKFVSAIFIIVSVVLALGTFKVEPAFDMERTMGKKVPYVNSLLEVSKSELGSLYSYDVMIEFPEDGDAKRPVSMTQLEKLSNYADKMKLTKRTTSILDILKDLNQTLNVGEKSFYAIPSNEDEIAQMLLLYENAGGTESEYWMDYDYRRLRLMVEIENFNSAETERELAELEAEATKLFPDAKVTMVGNLPQFTTMMQYLVRGQVQSFFLSVLIIGFILMIVFQSIRVGLIGLIPNLFPAICVGGYMGYMDMPLDMMTACIIQMILGMAVDDTIHFITHSKLEYIRTGHYRPAIKNTFHVVGTAIITSSLITSAVFATFTTSVCEQFRNFGILSIIGVMAALVADLFITPILVDKFHVYGKEKNINK